MSQRKGAVLTIVYDEGRENWLLMMSGLEGDVPLHCRAFYSRHTLDRETAKRLVRVVKLEMESWLF